MRTVTRPVIEDRPPVTSNRTLYIAVVFGIVVISLLLLSILLLPVNVHADWILRLFNSY